MAHGGEGLVEAGSGAGGAGEAVVRVDAVLGDTQLQEDLALDVQVLPVGGTSGRIRRGLPLRALRSWGKCTDRFPHPQLFPYHSYETLLAPFGGGRGDRPAVRWTIPLRTTPGVPE